MTVPVINSISPKFGPNDAATNIIIIGTGFDPLPSVYIGDNLCENISRPSANVIRCDVPANIIPGSYDVRIVNTGLEEVTAPIAYRVIYPLAIPPYSGETQAVITNRILQGMDEKYDVSTASFLYAMASLFALELSRAYIRINDTIDQFFPQSARADYLDRFGESHGILREPALRASGEIVVTGVNGTAIPTGSQFSTVVLLGQLASPLVYETLEDAVISGGTVTIPVRATLAGSRGNVGPNQVTRLLSPIIGINLVNNPTAMEGGQDTETDDDFRVRILYFMANPAAAGNRADYERWALEVPGVDSVVVFPLARGNGTVDVGILGETFPWIGAEASAILTMTANPTNGQQVTINGKTYTFKSTITASDGDVQIASTVAMTRDNLVAAINLEAGVGTSYATGTTVHSTVYARAIENTSNMSVHYRRRGTIGNAAAVTETLSAGSWSGATLSGGLDVVANDPDLVALVQEYIAPDNDLGGGKAPIGADADVISPTTTFIGVTVDLDVATGYDQTFVQREAEANIREYLRTLPIGQDVIYVHVGNVVHDTAGVSNYRNLLVNGNNIDVSIASNNKALDGIVVVT